MALSRTPAVKMGGEGLRHGGFIGKARLQVNWGGGVVPKDSHAVPQIREVLRGAAEGGPGTRGGQEAKDAPEVCVCVCVDSTGGGANLRGSTIKEIFDRAFSNVCCDSWRRTSRIFVLSIACLDSGKLWFDDLRQNMYNSSIGRKCAAFLILSFFALFWLFS